MIGFNLHKVRRHFAEVLAQRFSDRESEQLLRVLLEDLFGFDRKRLLMEPDLRIDEAQYAQLQAAVAQLLEGVPVQYVTGLAQFDNNIIKVNPSVLIPRPETEELVGKVAECLQGEGPVGWGGASDMPLRIWDIGTGSGCIAIALAKRFPQSEVKAFDLSREALEVAAENALANEVEVEFICDDVLHPRSEVFGEPVDVVVSNPPYIRDSERATMEPNVLDHEPSQALFVPDDDPLLYYRQILLLAQPQLKPGGVVWFEINEALGEEMLRLCEEYGFHPILLEDYASKPRFIFAKKCS